MAKKKKKQTQKKQSDSMIFLRRLSLRLGVAVFVLWVGSWIWLSGSLEKLQQWGEAKIVTASVDMGFTVQNLLVEGRSYTDPDILRGIVNVQIGDPLLSFDPKAIRSALEEITWVKSARVERRFPNTLYIGLTERQPMALWQKNRRLSVIDREGAFLTDYGLKRFESLIIIAGDDAPKHAPELLDMLAAEPILSGQMESASRIGERRWDLKTGSGIEVRLPEEDVGFAISRLAKAQEEDGLLNKEIKSIDLRKTDRIIIRTRPGKVQEYKAGYKAGNNI